MTNEGVDSMVSKITSIYSLAADISLKRNVKPRKTKNKKWFSNDLGSLKKHVIYLSGLLQKYPTIPHIRGAFFRTMKHYNKERKRKKRQFKQKILDRLDDLKDKDPNSYWRILDSLKNPKDDTDCISSYEWKHYFTNLNNKTNVSHESLNMIKEEIKNLESIDCFNELNFKITESELLKNIKLLKNKKAVGFDCICNEMIKYSKGLQ